MRMSISKRLFLTLGVVTGLLLAGCAPTPTPEPPPTLKPTITPEPTATTVPTATPMPTATPTPQPIVLTVLHTNDTEGYIEPCG